MKRWLAWTVLLVGLAGMPTACAQDLDLESDLGDVADAAPDAKPTSVKTPARDPAFDRQAVSTGVKSVVVPEGVDSPGARSIGAYFDSGKKLFTDEVGHCQFMFPAAPTYSKVTATTKFAPIAIRNFELKMKGAIVTLAHTSYPEEFTKGFGVDLALEPYKMLTLANDSQLKARPGSKLVARGKVKVQGYPSLEQVISYPETKTPKGVAPAGVVFGRCTLCGRDMYAISIRLDKEKFEENAEQSRASVKAFMESLKIIE